MNEILPGLYLGDEDSSRDLTVLQENKISHILIVGRELRMHYADVCKEGKRLRDKKRESKLTIFIKRNSSTTKLT